MYGRKANGELKKQSELEEARLGFIQFLRRKRVSPQFIASHGDDLFATAALEYSRKVAEGEVIDSPAGWLITCAWRRTKSLLEAQGRSPQIVSTDKAEAIEDELGRTPEDVTLEEDRLRKVQEAVGTTVREPERRLLRAGLLRGPGRPGSWPVNFIGTHQRHSAAMKRRASSSPSCSASTVWTSWRWTSASRRSSPWSEAASRVH